MLTKLHPMGNVTILVMPFFRRSKELQNSVRTLSELGAHVIFMKQGTDGLPHAQRKNGRRLSATIGSGYCGLHPPPLSR